MTNVIQTSHKDIQTDIKKLKVMYIDRKDDFQSVFESVKSNVDFSFCHSVTQASQMINSQPVDVILFDMMSSDYTAIKEFFKEFSDKIPIIAVSSSTDPKIAYMAAKMNAIDFLYKDREALVNISSDIQRDYAEWTRKKQEIKDKTILKDSAVRKIIKDLINTELPITQKIDSTSICEINLNDIIKTNYRIQSREIINSNPNILDILTDMDLVTKEHAEQTLCCPKCNSVNLFPHYSCDTCKHSQFVKKDKIKHFSCNYIIQDETFDKDDHILCPNCMEYIDKNSSEYEIIHNFECLKCLKSFTLPTLSYSCNSCNLENFSLKDGKWINLYQYIPNLKNLNSIKGIVGMFSDLEHYLEKEGFQVKNHEMFINKILNLGPLELVAFRGNQILFFTFLNGDMQQDIKQILEVEQASKSISTDKFLKSFAIFLDEPQDITLQILEKCKIIPFVEQNAQDIVNKLKNYI